MDGTDDSKIGAAIPGTRASTWRFVPARMGSSIERTHYAERAAVHDVRRDHRRPHVLVAEQALDCANVRARLQEVGGEAMPQGVAGRALVDLRRSRRIVYGPLNRRFVQVMQDGSARRWVGTGARGGEEILPGKHRRRARHLGAHSVGEIDFPTTGGNLDPVASCHLVELSAQSVADPYRQQRRSIVTSFGAAHHDLVALEVDILNPQRQAFEPSETTPVEYFGDEAEERMASFEEGLDLAAREDRRAVLGSTGALQAFRGRHFQAEDALVEEDEGAKGLVLSRGRDATLHGEVVQEGRGFEGAHISGMAAVVEADERADPVEVGLFGARRIVQSVERVPHGFEEGHDEVSTRAAERVRGWYRFSRCGATGLAGARGGARCAQDGRGEIWRGLEWNIAATYCPESCNMSAAYYPESWNTAARDPKRDVGQEETR